MNVSALQQPGQTTQTFEDRRSGGGEARPEGLPERRQFRDARNYSNPEAAELGDAIDQYKLENRRRFITWDELYDVITELGYEKKNKAAGDVGMPPFSVPRLMRVRVG